MHVNIGTLLPRHATYRPDKTAVIFQNHTLTFRQLNGRVNRIANALVQLGLQKGNKLATILPNCLEQLELFWAVAKLGVVVVPLSPMLRGSGLSRLLNDSDSVAVVTNAEFAPQLDKIRGELANIPSANFIVVDGELDSHQDYQALTAVSSDTEPPFTAVHETDPYNIIYSSGTTGLPKGIVHTHAIRAAYCTGFATAYRITPESVILHTGSLVFNGAFLTLMPAMFQGCTYILHPYFDAQALIETVMQEKVTHLLMVPSQIIAMMHAPNFDPAKMQSLEMICSVGAPLHLEHKEELDRHLPGRFYELYGLTEGFVTILDKYDFPNKPGSVGAPPPLYEMKIVNPAGKLCAPGEVGEIVGRGPITMAGYYKRPDLTAQALRDGWLHSGDLGHVDEDGFLYLVDRQKDLIISGGVNVYPRDIEELIVQHPAVRETAVFGIPDDKWGETPMATVILHEPGAISEDALRDWVNNRVEARYQKVSRIVIMDDFPRSVAGKTLKRVMREPYWADKGTEI
ncbi:class I adenylate-forming enzyme family protein [Candidatus Leptofilum sp.]|uniref:class I adenylate-forming enzyme family protein n=1 Tax=Candidatus Leptofilum sp. TaxID=3241576 RepID=UPI003B5C77FA